MTRYEAEILEIINTSHDHLTAEEIFLELKKKEPKVVLASIYNNLNRLFEGNRIVKVCIPGQPDRFDKPIKHDHLFCSVCGRIEDFSFKDLKDRLEKELGVGINGYDLKVSYVCPECRSNNKEFTK